MKKLVFILIAVFSVALTSCSCFDSGPIEPEIIGAGHLHYDSQSEHYSVCVDSVQYTVARITIGSNYPHTLGKTKDEAPFEGMFVTIFTSPQTSGVQAVAGQQSSEQIEALYNASNRIILVLPVLLVMGAILVLAASGKKKVKIIYADL